MPDLPPDPVELFARDWQALVGDARDARALVALSGGPDSTALLLLLQATLGERCIAATVDHRLRPGSAGEAAAAAALCAARGIDHAILTGPLPERVAGSGNVSARARALRYDLLGANAVARGAEWIATGHHADDQRETVVMRLNRGAGLAGLAGIRAIRGRVVRPLLGWRRAELAALVAANGIEPVADPSNHDDRYDRARLRKALAGGGTGAEWLDPDGVVRSARALVDAEAALDWTARHLLAERGVAIGDDLRLDTADLPFDLVRRLVLIAMARIDPAAPPPAGPALVRFCTALAAGRRAMLGAVLATPEHAIWHFHAAPAPSCEMIGRILASVPLPLTVWAYLGRLKGTAHP